MNLQDLNKLNLPGEPGVYLFKKGSAVLYVGKATSLRSRTRSYFAADLAQTRGAHVVNMVAEATTVGYTKTDSVLEALILEAQLIKKLQPPYNTRDKDDKSFLFVTITDESFPRVLLTRGAGTYGPFPGAQNLRTAYELIRKLFPFNTHEFKDVATHKVPLGKVLGYPRSPSGSHPAVAGQDRPDHFLTDFAASRRPCFDYELGVCPGTCIGKMGEREYRKTIRNIKLFFEGKKKRIISILEKEMNEYAKQNKFEEAGERKRQIFALQHIRDIALIREEIGDRSWKMGNSYSLNSQLLTPSFRIEAYDIAHMSGNNSVGVMTVIENGIAKTSEYRKFKIKKPSDGSVNDIANLREVLTRRLGHAEWPLPNLIVTDGGNSQKNTAESVLKEKGFNIPVVSVVKDERHKPREILGDKKNIMGKSDAILLANSESHRFAIAYHKLLRKKNFLP